MQVHSDWGDWLPREIEDASPDGVAIWYLGCNGVVLKASDGTTVFVDPYLGTGDPPRTVRMIPVPFDPGDVSEADAILATHEHTDHVHGPSQAPLMEHTGATFYGPDASVAVSEREAWGERWDVDPDQFTVVSEGDSFEVGPFTVHVEEAHDPDAVHPVSYVVDHDAGTFFHGGDTKPDGVLAEVGSRHDVDVGVLAFGSVGMVPDKKTREPKRTRWYADENGIVEAAEALQIDRLIPSHWDMWRGLTADPSAIVHHARSFEYPRHVDLLQIGDRTDL